MAKQFKFNIKNTQLAEALNLKGVKKKMEEKSSPEPSVSSKPSQKTADVPVDPNTKGAPVQEASANRDVPKEAHVETKVLSKESCEKSAPPQEPIRSSEPLSNSSQADVTKEKQPQSSSEKPPSTPVLKKPLPTAKKFGKPFDRANSRQPSAQETPAPRPAHKAKARSRSVFADTKDGTRSSPSSHPAMRRPNAPATPLRKLNVPGKACPEGLQKLASGQREQLGPTGKHITDLKPPKRPSAKPSGPAKAAVSPKEPPTKPSTRDDDRNKKKGKGAGAKAKEFRDLKPKRSKGSFDGRDKQGLRGDDEGGWRRKRTHKGSRGSHEEHEILRPKELTVRLPICLKDLAQEMKLKASELIQKLFVQGMIVTLNEVLEDPTTVELLGQEFGVQISIDTSLEEKIRITDKTVREEISEAATDDLVLRPPVVTFMGHVDHGKTSLIDTIRSSNVASQEAGAITQHIGAFKCKTKIGDITILDTPGHEAFSAMRARGAQVTDIVVLVVAGDEGFRTQTDEAMQHAKAAGVTIVVAINKSDKPNFNPDTVYRQLADRELLPEAWGGDTVTINTSAITREGIEELLEMLALQAEVLELRAQENTRARGVVIESEMHKGMGAQANLLVLNGTLKQGDALVFGRLWGRVKTMRDQSQQSIQIAGPSTPCEITGLSGLPKAGDEFIVVASEKEAKEIAEKRADDHRTQQHTRANRSIENLLQMSQELEKKILNVILRADVQGSLEALKVALGKITSDKVDLNVIFSGVGEVSESDIQLAQASKAVVVGFHTSVEKHAEQLVKELGVQVRIHDIIYHAIDDIKDLMTGTLDKLAQEEERGVCQVLQTFKSSQVGLIAGCMVQEGTISRNYKVRLKRDGQVIHQGSVMSLKRMKEDVKEVRAGFECGVVLQGTQDVQPDDIIEAFEIVYVQQAL